MDGWRAFFFFKQKTAYEIKECDWSSDVCSSDLLYDLLHHRDPQVAKCFWPWWGLRTELFPAQAWGGDGEGTPPQATDPFLSSDSGQQKDVEPVENLQESLSACDHQIGML